jgi:signal transduction histidine kinase
MESTDQRVNVLLVEDDANDARLLMMGLARAAPGRFDVVHADRLGTALEHVGTQNFDVVLLDLSLPDGNGLPTFLKLRNADTKKTPIVVLTGLDDEAVAMQAVRNGAQDYLVKGQVNAQLVIRSIRYAIERAQMHERENNYRQQAEMKDRFLSHVSHELRMPLAVIYQAMTNVLNGNAGEITPEQRECLEIAVPNVKQLRRMIDELLEVARSETASLRIQFQQLNLKDLLSRTVQSLQSIAKAKNICLERAVFPDDLPEAYGDPSRIEQVLLNLFDNALKFTPAEGVIRTRAHLLTEKPGFIRVAVEDTGCGVAEEARERVFERFQQEPQAIESSRSGLGIGLYLSKELIDRHGGDIWVASQPGQGSTFFFTLPTSPQPAKQAEG